MNLNAGKNVAIAGSKVTAGENIAIEGDSVSIIGAQEQHDASSSSKKSGFGVGSGGGFYSIYGKKQKSSSENIVANVGSQLSAGNDVSIKARETDVNVVGSKVEAKNDIALDAARDVNILPGAESYASEDKEKRSGFGIQLKSGSGSASIGIGFGSSKDETRQGVETNAVSSLNAGRDIIITAGRDANLQAAQVEAGSTVDILAERDVSLHKVEVRKLELIFKRMGISSDDLYAQLHDGTLKNVLSARKPKSDVGDAPRKGIDLNRLQLIRAETTITSSVLSDIFEEEITEDSFLPAEAEQKSDIFEGLEHRYGTLLSELSQKSSWPATDFDLLIRQAGMLPGAAKEAINEWGLDTFDELIIEGADPLLVNIHVLPSGN